MSRHPGWPTHHCHQLFLVTHTARSIRMEITLKYALQRIMQYTLKVISIMDQLLKISITVHVLFRHYRVTEEVSGSCTAFHKWKSNCKSTHNISINHPELADQINSRLSCSVKALWCLGENHCGVICVVNSMLLLMPPSVLISTPFVLQNKMWVLTKLNGKLMYVIK